MQVRLEHELRTEWRPEGRGEAERQEERTHEARQGRLTTASMRPVF